MLPAATGSIGFTGSRPCDGPGWLLQENLSADTPAWLPGGAPARGPAVKAPKARDDSVPGPKMPSAMWAASTNPRQLW